MAKLGSEQPTELYIYFSVECSRDDASSISKEIQQKLNEEADMTLISSLCVNEQKVNSGKESFAKVHVASMQIESGKTQKAEIQKSLNNSLPAGRGDKIVAYTIC